VRYRSAPTRIQHSIGSAIGRGTGGSAKLGWHVNQRLRGFAGSHASLARVCVMYLAYERFISVESEVIETPRM
jgi:hypothetical protein